MLHFKNFRGDFFGGLTAGIVALPLALAFGVQSGMGASAGLYGAMALGLFAALFGGTETQISGPTGPMTVVSATVVTMAISIYGSLENAMGIILLTFLLAGVFQIIFGLLKIGKYVKFIPYPVLSGFMSGIGVIIIIFQLLPSIGLASPAKIRLVFTNLFQAIDQTNFTALILTLSTIVLIYIIPKISKAIPSTLIALIVVTLGSNLLQLDVPLIGKMAAGVPTIKLGAIAAIQMKDIGFVLIPAITLAGLGTIDSLLTSVVADNISRTKHNSNKELIGQGIGNIAASFIGGIPGAGATMRTLVNYKSGGRTKLSGVIHSMVLILVLVGLGNYVAYIPLSVLAGILITVGISIIDIKGLKNIVNMSKGDAFILLIVLFLTIFVDLLEAVGIGMVLASLIFMRKASEMVENTVSLEKVEKYDREIAWSDEKNFPLQQDFVYIKRFDGPLFFGVASKMMERINKIPSNAKVIIFRMKKVPFIDQSGLYALEEVIKEMQKAGIVVVMTMLQPQPLYMLRKNRFIPNILADEYLFHDIESCSLWLKEYCEKCK